MTEDEISFDRAVRGTCQAPDRREVWAWGAEFMDFGSTEAFKGHYNVENTPWTRDFLRAFRDPYVRELTFIGPPQESGKTFAAEIALLYRACNQPAKMAFNTTTNVKADGFAETKWKSAMSACSKISDRFSGDRHQKKRRRIVFKDGSFLIIQGAETPGNRQSDSIEVQVNDEVALWERPWLAQMHNRLRAYRETRKIVNISFGGVKGTEIHEHFQAGTQNEWSHVCPACGRPFQYVFDNRSPACNIKFDLAKAVLHPNGSLDLREFAKTVFVFCQNPVCGQRFEWSADLMAQLNSRGVYVPMNPGASREVESFHVNAFAIGRRPWAQILEPWVRMNLKGTIFAMEVLKEFVQMELAEFWEDRPIIVSTDLKLATYLRAEMIKPGAWPDEWVRMMAVDNQRGQHGDIPHRWFVCRAFARDGRTRLVDCGRLNEWEQVREKQHELGIPDWTAERPGPWVVVDRAYDPTQVDEVCSRFKWFGMLGQPTDEFVHGPRSPYAEQRMFFSEPRAIDIGFGTAEAGRNFAVYHLWSSERIQDLLAAIRQNAEQFALPSDLMEFAPEYADHINSHRQTMKMTPAGQEKLTWVKIGGWPDHLYDCESMLVVLGLMAGVFQRP
jgi:hypothetical protein